VLKKDDPQLPAVIARSVKLTYDPAKVRGVSIYEPEVRTFAEGDRVQFTAPLRVLGVSNRDLGRFAISMRREISGLVSMKNATALAPEQSAAYAVGGLI
jgi:hypothetical protein